MQNQNQQQASSDAGHMPSAHKHGGHEIMDAHEAISTLTGSLEQYLLYEEHIQDPALMQMLQRQREFMSTLYNTMIETLQTGKDPSIKIQTYLMEESNDVAYGMSPTAPKAPVQTVSEIDDQCVSSYMMGNLKACATGFTTAALETTNPVLRRIFADSVPNMIEMAYEVFLYQNKNQYYQVPQLQPQDMQAIMNGFAPIQGNTMH